MSGTLYVVATPIGNLEDITLRALRVLREVALIAAEDTRRTARLLAHYSITTRTVSFHTHNTRARLPQLISRLQAGENIALVTDAGTPCVSDPGLELVQACIAGGIPVDPIPGASAPLAALVASGFPMDPVTLLGFPPNRGKDRKMWLERVASLESTVVCFEAPHRIGHLLKELRQYMGSRPIMIGRELTKLHQDFQRGTAEALLAELKEPKGEFTVVLGPYAVRPMAVEAPSAQRLAHEFGQLTDNGEIGKRAAILELANRYSYRPRQVYALLEEAKDSGD